LTPPTIWANCTSAVGKGREGSAYLEQAQRIDPLYDNGYDLALAYILTTLAGAGNWSTIS